MSLFGSEKKISVASVVYNMAGDEEARPNYLKTLIVRSILTNDQKTSISDSLHSGFMNGPGMKFRSFYRWANNNYDYVGMPSALLGSDSSINTDVLRDEIPHPAEYDIWVQNVDVSVGDYTYWVEKYFLDNDPDLLDSDWSSDINDKTKQVIITLEDNSKIYLNLSGFNPKSKYVYTYYTLVKSPIDGELSTGVTNVNTSSSSYPSITGWSILNSTSNTQNVTLNTHVQTHKEYSDGRPNEDSSSQSSRVESYNKVTRDYYTQKYIGDASDNEDVKLQRRWMYQEDYKVIITETTSTTSSDVVSGVTVTTTVTTNKEVLSNRYKYRIDSKEDFIASYSGLKLNIYKVGSGNTTIDAAITVNEDYGKCFPVIPVRQDGDMINEDYDDQEVYQLVKKAYKKATGSKYLKLLDKINDNEKIGDIDFAYVIFGVSLNVKENACKKYIYKFFTKLMNDQIGGPTVYNDYIVDSNNFYNNSQAIKDWREQMANYHGDNMAYLPMPSFNRTRPNQLENEFIVNTEGEWESGYAIRISWSYISETIGTGLGKSGAKKGDYWIVKSGYDTLPGRVIRTNSNGDQIFSEPQKLYKFRVYWQESDNVFRYLEIVNMIHRNIIYGGKYVEINSQDALNSDDESGFIVPLHYLTYKEMGIKDATQMATACMFLVFNTYEITKVRWYERGIFKIILIVAIAVVSALFTGGAGIGILGTNLAVGTAVGATGLTAAIVGSVVNALAAAVLMSVLDVVARGVFGEQLGQIIGAVFAFLAMQAISAFQATGSFALDWGNLIRPENLLKIGDALGRGYGAYVQGDIQQMNAEVQELNEKANDQYDSIQKKLYEQFGYGNSGINGTMFTGSNKIFVESGDTFLTRTLMTGTDIAHLATTMVTDFVSLSLKLPDVYD